jgi:hypothetical protein
VSVRIFAAAILSAGLVAASAAAGTGPTIAVHTQPLGTVHGTGFPHRVRVVLTATSTNGGKARSVAVESSTAGTFTARLLIVPAPSCNPTVFTITARVAGRVRATARLVTPHSRDCAQPIAP